MSAPDTNIERQAQRHWAPIFGICAALVIGVVLGLGIAYVTDLNGPQLIDGGASAASGG